MTLDEAIKHAEDVAKTNTCKECAEEHRQLAEWLKDYKRFLEQQPCDDCISRRAVLEITAETGALETQTRVKSLPPVTPQEPKTGWIPVKTRPMTEEETEHYSEYTDMRIDDTYTILDCPLPDDGQEVLVSWGGNVVVDIFIRDDADGCYFEGVDIDEVDAWMPLPEPYKESEGEK